jgi:hypothetical protein
LEVAEDLDTTGGAGVDEIEVDGGDFVDWGARVLCYYCSNWWLMGGVGDGFDGL